MRGDVMARTCDDFYNCCSCGTEDQDNGCGCRYCFSCNACEACLEDNMAEDGTPLECEYKDDD